MNITDRIMQQWIAGRVGKYTIINTETLCRLPYGFDTAEQAQRWITSYGVSEAYKQNYKVIPR